MRRPRVRQRRALATTALAALAAVLVACTGLPSSGPVQAGLPIGEDGELADPTPIAQGPSAGAGPEEIVAGFLQASVTPAGNWDTAQKFLTDEFADAWKPDAAVTVDDTVASRTIDSDADPDDDEAAAAEVQVQLDQVASINATGAYSEEVAPAKQTYHLIRPEGGEWRISDGPDGIVLDAASLSQVYRKYALQYFDRGWTHLVPDVRWFPRRGSMATSVTRALISGEPSAWLAPAVRTAYPDDVSLAGDAVPVDAAQVADVSLTRAALSASPSTLARMRTQLEASLLAVGVSEVRFSVDGTPLEAGRVSLDDAIAAPGVLVLDAESFGTAVNDEVTPVAAITAQIAKITEPIAAIDVAGDGSLAAMQTQSGDVYAITEGSTDELDQRSDLIEPSVDPFGFVWTVPRDAPGAVEAWDAQVVRHPIAQAWPDARSISHLRVSADGARVAAVVTTGGQRKLMVAAVIRGEDSVPQQLGPPHEVSRLENAALGLSWVGADSVAVLTNAQDPQLTTQVIGGPSATTPAPVGARALAGAKSTTGLRVLSSDGVVYAQRGSSWQKSVSDVLVLGTWAGY